MHPGSARMSVSPRNMGMSHDRGAVPEYLHWKTYGRRNERIHAKGDYAAIVDATHPYAVVVSSNIRQASAQAGLPYYRLRRTLQSAGDDSDVIYVKSQQECVRALEQTSGNILLTTGSKELHCYCEN